MKVFIFSEKQLLEVHYMYVCVCFSGFWGQNFISSVQLIKYLHNMWLDMYIIYHNALYFLYSCLLTIKFNRNRDSNLGFGNSV